MNVVSHIKYSRINQELVIIVIVNIIQPNPGEEEALIYDSLTLPALYAIRNELEMRSRETTQRDKKKNPKATQKSEKGKGNAAPKS